MNLEEFLAYLVSSPSYNSQISHIEHIPSRPSADGELEKPLQGDLEKSLKELYMWPLYTHQAEAVNIARRGENVIISTPSASGKSLAYNIPVWNPCKHSPYPGLCICFQPRRWPGTKCVR
jgi:DEAD/DEAH box helicase domain-containing protein